MTERKMGNTQSIRSMQARFKCDVKIDRKRIKRDGKRAEKSARR
jgi:hypothetical protein